MKNPRTRLIKLCGKLFRTLILSERPPRCEKCGMVKPLQVSHILPKSTHPRLRFVRDNVLLLCYRCHFHYWHKSPLDAWEFIYRLKGDNYKDKLLIIEKGMDKHTTLYLEALAIFLERELERRGICV